MLCVLYIDHLQYLVTNLILGRNWVPIEVLSPEGEGRGVGVGVLGSLFAGYVPLASQSIVHSLANYKFHLGRFCNFRHPNLVTSYLCIHLILNKEHSTFHLQYKHSGTFAKRKYDPTPS